MVRPSESSKAKAIRLALTAKSSKDRTKKRLVPARISAKLATQANTELLKTIGPQGGKRNYIQLLSSSEQTTSSGLVAMGDWLSKTITPANQYFSSAT